jgi:hypothetical protein
MELFIIIALAGLWVAGATLRAILTDGRGHTPSVRSTDDWRAGRLPSVPFSAVDILENLAGGAVA